MNPIEISKQALKQALTYLANPNRNKEHEADIKRKAAIYHELINDPEYKEVQADLFARKITEKETAIRNIPLTYSLEQIGKEYIKLRVEIDVFSDLLNAPERHFMDNERLKIVEELERKEAIK